ncbi:helix-turn-helix transcriptional regulator [Rhizobium cauense]|uniref:ATP-binding protein n=1 Tax=Rhizobium cauense TaxID=1166683 RepID=UPI001C6ECD69|nr:winged helix-turn-helix domain-containing protein [Rhizobium cauense]MBW9116901.1 helix-turn-helix transcriptional regulator [Rhizobium cauense]
MSLLQFDNYEIDIEQRRLTEHGQPLRLGGRAFDILSTLVSRAGEVVTKEELISHVWPTTIVDEGSLRVHLVALRKTLGDRARRYVETIPGRGYLFAGDVRQIPRENDIVVMPQLASSPLAGNLPRIPKRLVGREECVRSTLELLESARLLTLVGPGGVGKTAVAVVCANVLAESKRVVFLDLATLADGDALLSSLATHLGLNTFGDVVLPGVLAELSRTDTVLFLDGCERVVDAAAHAAETILRESTTTQIVTTTRELLRTPMEKVRQIPPLEFPSDTENCSDIEAYPAVELFLSLAALAGDGVDISRRQDLQIVGDIVGSLDGIPLAIELAAARVFEMDLPTLHRSVADPIAFLRRGRRTAPPRQQTMRATLDWSYSTLSGDEKELLLRLSIFAGTFTTDAALSVWESTDRVDSFHDAFDGLFLKSFLVATQRGGSFRLLLTTRDYAREKLDESSFSMSCRQAHSAYCLERPPTATGKLTRLS